ncbi:MAG: coenzyme F420-0:L-glutamate ligase [Armatimonadota bacterium]
MAKTKSPTIDVSGRSYLRIPLKTHVIQPEDDIVEVARRYAGPQAQPGDIVFVSEKVVAITQGRAVPTDRIRVSWLASKLWPFVRQVPYGIGLRNPYSMQCAIDECGAPRILLAAAAGAVGKLLGRRGDFYRIAGVQAAAIDAPGTAGIEQFRDCVIKGPKDPDQVSQRIADALGCHAAVVDVNDIDSAVLGQSRDVDPEEVRLALKDNPLGQGAEQTPLGILRKT